MGALLQILGLILLVAAAWTVGAGLALLVGAVALILIGFAYADAPLPLPRWARRDDRDEA